MTDFFGFLPKRRGNTSSLFNIIKKWAKTGNLNSVDVIRAGILVADKIDKASPYNKKGKLKRKDFSKTDQELTLIKQAYRCNICKKKLDVVILDHIDGNRSNNDISNCQALCPNCHAIKTRNKKKR